RRRHTRSKRDWSSDVCSSDLQGSVLSFVPDIGSPWMPMITFFVYIAVNWWATWYPGAEPGGGGYVAQRMLSAKDEKHSLLATLRSEERRVGKEGRAGGGGECG